MPSVFFIGVALSMDAFSIAISLGTTNLNKKQMILIPFVVSIMHYIMPLIGLYLGTKLLSIININPKVLVSLILLILAYLMFNDRKVENKTKITNFLSIFLFAFSVSIDSFSVGIGLRGLTNHIFLAPIIFMLVSGSITYIGLLLGKYSVKIFKQNSIIFGIIILILISIINLLEIFT